ncbi:futalosine hydrolase [Mucilaginibacter sp. X4EP1]|uniref:futalosine hydrolase n=1 Tax=Mucilaginibacter sp. X4EP1 TaxID=2723092 RepID=UPI002168C182|nr:futalosine hydrolase [Mucilaginibacter sp. X4EP1]MCS3814481.1 futalosine hydrolase [Mucilaginibacter sp. X4EP1]
MKILIVAATEAEVAPLISEFGISKSDFSEDSTTQNPDCKLLTANCYLLTTGVGMVATAFALGKHLAVNTYDLVVNLGIAGSFDRGIALGEVLEITEDVIAELGAEDDDKFIPIDELGFGKGVFHPTTEISNLYNLFNTFNLKKARAITVNTVHGNEASIAKVAARLNPQLESMEGAAFFYVCQQMNVPCLQIRAVSNYVEKRNRDAWKIGLAIKNLNTFAIEFLKLYA